MSQRDNLILMAKAFIMGSSMSVPGISGGTLAIIFGIYDRLLSAISYFTRDIKANTIFLAKVCISGALGLFLLANLIEWLLETAPLAVSFFFLGLVLASIPVLYQKTRIDRQLEKSGLIIRGTGVKGLKYLLFGLGFIFVLGVGLLPAGLVELKLSMALKDLLVLFLVGMVVSLALVLPGISSAHMLLVLGLYDEVVLAISSLNLVFILALGLAILLGVFIVAKPISWMMDSYPAQTYWVIIGFVLGSTIEIFKQKIIPAIPLSPDMGWWLVSGLVASVMLALGALLVHLLARLSE